ncbi:Internalin-A precursor [Falsiruegeria litorea R37]|uniref:Internalin-A n=1 Tax=Falsiruegeria litorea R37 TaxID=1200284 RepID=A0A1Y5SKW5_9RHOB|nr:leucine-rich repeat domain-containing protein [Falsiruegeria litorea]SLN43151.1 Internalin-A precursor [Falsiruegeria litorea R37]
MRYLSELFAASAVLVIVVFVVWNKPMRPTSVASEVKQDPIPQQIDQRAPVSVADASSATAKRRSEYAALVEQVHGSSTFKTCERDGMQGIKLPRTCVIPTDRKLALDQYTIGLLPHFAGYTEIESVRLGGEIATLDVLLGFPKLKSLYLWHAKLRDPTALRRLTGLQHISLESTDVSDLNFLSTQPRLKTLTVFNSPVSDLSPLRHLSTLTKLDLRNLPASDLSPLARLTSLKKLTVMELHPNSLSPLSDLSQLKKLDLSYNRLPDLDPLASLSGLKRLRIADAGVKDIAALAPLVGLQQLELDDNPIRDVSPLVGLPHLSYLDLSGTLVSDLSALPEVEVLKRP